MVKGEGTNDDNLHCISITPAHRSEYIILYKRRILLLLYYIYFAWVCAWHFLTIGLSGESVHGGGEVRNQHNIHRHRYRSCEGRREGGVTAI